MSTLAVHLPTNDFKEDMPFDLSSINIRVASIIPRDLPCGVRRLHPLAQLRPAGIDRELWSHYPCRMDLD